MQHFISSYGYLAIVLLMIALLVIAGTIAVIVRRRKRPPAARPGPAADPVSVGPSEQRRRD
jgi:hypothetical protein